MLSAVSDVEWEAMHTIPGLVVVVTSSKLKKEKPTMVYLQSGHHLLNN